MELPIYERKDRVPLPPRGAKVQTTACAYCAVGCGYKVYTWPVGAEGGPTAKENAFGANFPNGFEDVWVSPNQHTVVLVEGKQHHCVVVPDAEATVVNPGGNHSIRGGTLALKCYTVHGADERPPFVPSGASGGQISAGELGHRH